MDDTATGASMVPAARYWLSICWSPARFGSGTRPRPTGTLPLIPLHPPRVARVRTISPAGPQTPGWSDVRTYVSSQASPAGARSPETRRPPAAGPYERLPGRRTRVTGDGGGSADQEWSRGGGMAGSGDP